MYYRTIREEGKRLEELKTEIMAMVSRISDQKKLELIHRFLIRILRDKKE